MGMFTAISVGLVVLALRAVPLPEALLKKSGHWELLDRHGTPLRLVRPDGLLYQTRVEFQQLPPALIHATLTAEDRRFFKHPGIDWRGYLRGVWQLARHRRVVSGGSTISQQLIKVVEPRPRTPRTKVVEALKALRLEQVWPKEEILTEYLNRVEYGNATAGVGAATLFYFRKPVSDLSPAECALLAALPQAPSRLNPHKHLQRARKRQLWILNEMRQLGYLTHEEHERAVAEPTILAKPFRPFQAPHFVDLLLRSGVLNTASLVESNPGARHTTIDLGLHRFVENALAKALLRLRDQQVQHAAAVVIENRTGDILALVGSPDYYDANGGQVNGAWVPRSTGSTLKPFTYALAFENGASPASIVADVPTDFPTPTGVFSPVNFDRHCSGPVSYRLALANSLNIPAVKVLNSVGGPAALHQKLTDLGLSSLTSSPEFYGLGLTIGNAEARLLELANAYASLARMGEFRPLRFLSGQYVVGSNPPKRVIAQGAAYLVADILADNGARALAFSYDSPLRFEFPVACKTGTSSNYRDNWAFGYTPEFTVGVWLGNFDNSPMASVSGVTGAAPILHEIVQQLHDTRGTSWYVRPGQITNVWVHRLTGKRLMDQSDEHASSSEAILEKVQAHALPPVESREDYDALGAVRLESEYARWFASSENVLGPRAVLISTNSGPLRILFPLPGTTFHLDPDLPQEGRIIYPRASTPNEVQWSSPTLKCSPDDGKTTVRLASGSHTLLAQDSATGASSETWFVVRDRLLGAEAGSRSLETRQTAPLKRSPALKHPSAPFASPEVISPPSGRLPSQ